MHTVNAELLFIYIGKGKYIPPSNNRSINKIHKKQFLSKDYFN